MKVPRLIKEEILKRERACLDAIVLNQRIYNWFKGRVKNATSSFVSENVDWWNVKLGMCGTRSDFVIDNLEKFEEKEELKENE